MFLHFEYKVMLSVLIRKLISYRKKGDDQREIDPSEIKVETTSTKKSTATELKRKNKPKQNMKKSFR